MIPSRECSCFAQETLMNEDMQKMKWCTFHVICVQYDFVWHSSLRSNDEKNFLSILGLSY